MRSTDSAGFDILVNNAGIDAGDAGKLSEFS